MRAQAVLFDKDGTLFDFQKSWSGWIGSEIRRHAEGDRGLAQRMADQIGFDLTNSLILPDSPAIAGTSRDVAKLMLQFMPGFTLDSLTRHFDMRAQMIVPVEVLPLVPFLTKLAGMGLRLGVATNDNELAARKHLDHFGISTLLDYNVGYDSGHGAKPDPGMCNAFARHCDVAADEVIMVGDSLHDLHAGRAAGMQTVAVLTGVAGRADLEGAADIVLPDIGHLPQWITG